MNQWIERIYSKKTFPKYFKYQFIPYASMFVLECIIDQQNPLVTLISVFIINIWSYFVHYSYHLIPKSINPHLFFHHEKDGEGENKTETTIVQKFVGDWLEILGNVWIFLLLYIIKKQFDITFIKDQTLFFACILYLSVHMINYSILHVGPEHSRHHNIEKICNVGPDVFDVLFNTKCDHGEDDEFENLNHMILNMIICFYITIALFDIKI